MRELVGRTAFVTGGASGIGLALGRAFDVDPGRLGEVLLHGSGRSFARGRSGLTWRGFIKALARSDGITGFDCWRSRPIRAD